MNNMMLTLLYTVSGRAAPGTLLAILGASGAGKTTLLNVLTNRNRGNLTVTGDVSITYSVSTATLTVTIGNFTVIRDVTKPCSMLSTTVTMETSLLL